MALKTSKELKALAEGTKESFEGVFIVRGIQQRTARNGSPFLMVDLGDRHGSFMITCFEGSQEFAFFTNSGEGAIVKFYGVSDHYQGRFSPKVTQLERVDEQQANGQGWMDALVELPGEDVDGLRAEYAKWTASIKDEALRKTVELATESLGDTFFTSPAAISMHHAYRSGLLEHTVHLARNVDALAPLYPEINRDLAMAGVLVHDMGKVIEYEGQLSVKKSRTGVLNGHVVLGYRIVRKAAMQAKLSEDRLERLEHIVLSHQGELEWGAAVMAATPEAVFVSMIDNLDAKMGMVQYALRSKVEGEVFSDYFPGLKSRVLVD